MSAGPVPPLLLQPPLHQGAGYKPERLQEEGAKGGTGLHGDCREDVHEISTGTSQ